MAGWKNFERAVARVIVEAGGEAERGLQFRGGSRVADVSADPFWIECKKGDHSSTLESAYKQAKKDALGGWIPVAVRAGHGVGPARCWAMIDASALGYPALGIVQVRLSVLAVEIARVQARLRKESNNEVKRG